MGKARSWRFSDEMLYEVSRIYNREANEAFLDHKKSRSRREIIETAVFRYAEALDNGMEDFDYELVTVNELKRLTNKMEAIWLGIELLLKNSNLPTDKGEIKKLLDQYEKDDVLNVIKDSAMVNQALLRLADNNTGTGNNPDDK